MKSIGPVYGSVVLRTKHGVPSDDTNSSRFTGNRAYVQRPRSWGEFQSNLTAFHPVAGPSRSSPTAIAPKKVNMQLGKGKNLNFAFR